MNIQQYHGIPLKSEEIEFLTNLEEFIQLILPLVEKIPSVEKIDFETFGFIVKDFHIIELGIFGCRLTSIPESIGNLQKVKKIILSENKLNHLPSSFQRLDTLEELYLDSNKFEIIPDCIRGLKNLRKFVCSFNLLSELPDFIGKLIELRILDLEWNNLASIPSSIGQLHKLIDFRLFENKISRLPESIVNLTALVYFSLDISELSSFPKSFRNLTHLEWLHLNPKYLQIIRYNETLKPVLEDMERKGLKIISLWNDEWIDVDYIRRTRLYREEKGKLY